MDRWLQRKISSEESSSVPRWNYLLLRVQFFIMYFVAGLKKFEPDWLWGYSMMSLGNHHAFTPFRCVYIYRLPRDITILSMVHRGQYN